ncbi:hypothetical protein [Niveispirillum sp.]|uniref:hypothetical protein n=1 Tax=Niveispirillum sp. TaxID=1917217 RepID=UPI001B51AAA7|nr:hypothetical protein [Niveispirillum sp.]MBP7336889.1 hypothetical protein [Niveispirillum sp.]
MTGLERLRAVLAQHGQAQGVGLLDAAIALSGQVGELTVLRALVDMAGYAATLSSHEARCVVMEAMADGGVMIATAEQAIRAGQTVSLTPVPDWAGRAAGRA